jgi:hypothetical protein
VRAAAGASVDRPGRPRRRPAVRNASNPTDLDREKTFQKGSSPRRNGPDSHRSIGPCRWAERPSHLAGVHGPHPVRICPTSAAPATEAERREARLAELVAGLTGHPNTGAARHAVRENQGEGDALEIVARAMLELEGPEPEGFRVAGFLREDALVVHGSLRRWDRLHGEMRRGPDRDAPFANRRTIDLG